MRPHLLATLLLSACASLSRAAEPCGPYVVGVYDSPLQRFDADGDVSGFNQDFLAELSRRTGCRFTHQVSSRIRIWNDIELGQVAITMAALITPEREKIARFIPYANSHNVIVMLPQVPSQARTPQGFATSEFRVGAVRGYVHGAFYEPWLDKMRARGRVYEVADLGNLLKQLANGRVHAAVLQVASLYRLRDVGLYDKVLKIDWAPDEKLLTAMACSRQAVTARDFERMNKAVAEMHADGSIERLFARYVGAETARQFNDF